MKNIALSDLEFSLFQKLIRQKCGIEITEDKAYLIESRLMRILVESGIDSFSGLYHYIQSTMDEVMVGKLISAITTNETLWFRDKTPWKILEEQYLPVFIEQLRTGERSKIRIWSAAASSGQEAYSTAMCIDNYLKTRFIRDVSLGQFEIIATDISERMLDIAKKARYDSIAINRGLDAGLRSRYFTSDGTVWEVAPEIKNAVKFQKFNLQNAFGILGKFDVIFCRYVLIYFSQELTAEIAEKLFYSLQSSGVLFLGSYEFSTYVSEYFLVCDYENASYYRKKEQ